MDRPPPGSMLASSLAPDRRPAKTHWRKHRDAGAPGSSWLPAQGHTWARRDDHRTRSVIRPRSRTGPAWAVARCGRARGSAPARAHRQLRRAEERDVEESKVPHLSYVGDADIGERSTSAPRSSELRRGASITPRSAMTSGSAPTPCSCAVTVGTGIHRGRVVITEDVPAGALASPAQAAQLRRVGGRGTPVGSRRGGLRAASRGAAPAPDSGPGESRAADHGRARIRARRRPKTRRRKSVNEICRRAEEDDAGLRPAFPGWPTRSPRALASSRRRPSSSTSPTERSSSFSWIPSGFDVFVLQSHTSPINEWIMEQLIMVTPVRRASPGASRGGAFFGYARQDKEKRAGTICARAHGRPVPSRGATG